MRRTRLGAVRRTGLGAVRHAWAGHGGPIGYPRDPLRSKVAMSAQSPLRARFQRLHVDDAEPRAEWTAAVRAVLEPGGIAALPTETVYGLAARADREAALARLAALKGRAPEQAFTWHIGDASALDLLRDPSPLARRLAARYWPGPLTLVLPGAPASLALVATGGWIGVRLPAHKATAGILRALDFPVVMSSANAHGAPPAVDADAVEHAFANDITLCLDGGRARLAEASTVLRLGAGRFELLREGLIDLRALRATAGLRIGFVCTGNTCRSPMAEGLARKLVAERLGCPPERIGEFGFEVRSCGVSAQSGEPAARNAISLLAEEGIDLSAHRARAAQDLALENFDHLYALTRSHLEALRMLLPPERANVAELLDPAGEDIADPIGGPREVYRRTAEQIRAALAQRVRDWA